MENSALLRGCLHPQSRPWTQAGEQLLSGAVQPLPGGFSQSPVSPAETGALSLPGPQVLKGAATRRGVRELEPPWATSAMGRRGWTPCSGVDSQLGSQAPGQREGRRGREVQERGAGAQHKSQEGGADSLVTSLGPPEGGPGRAETMTTTSGSALLPRFVFQLKAH